MSEYNPRTKGMEMYKAPEVKYCITCGQPLAPEVKAITNHMNNYLNPISRKSVGTINSDKPSLVIQGVTVYMITGKDSQGNPVSAYEPGLDGKEITPNVPKSAFPILEMTPETADPTPSVPPVPSGPCKVTTTP